MLELFDVRNTITRPFDRLKSEVNPEVETVSDYSASNYPCGTVNVTALTDLSNSIRGKIDDALDSLVELGAMLDNSITKGLETAAAVLGVIGLIEEIANTDFGQLADEAIQAVFDGIKDVYNAAKDVVDSFISTATSPFSFNGIDVPTENPIQGLANALKCDAAGLLGLASAALAATGMDPSMLDSAVDSVTGLMGDGSGYIDNVIKNTEDLINSSPISSAVFNLGYPILLATAMGHLNLSDREKTAAACFLAQSLNKFKNFDPFVEAVTNSSLIDNILGKLWDVNVDLESTSSCSCCFAKGKYEREELSINLNLQNYHASNAFLENLDTLQGIFTDWGKKKASRVSSDNISRLVNEKKLNEDNLLTRSLLMGLEGMRVAEKVKGNFQELILDKEKRNDFISESLLDLLYLKDLTQDTVVRNSFYSEIVYDKIREVS